MAPMSYADISKKNREAPEDQPKPDPGLLEHSDSDVSHSGASDDKVHIVTREEFENDVQHLDDEQRRVAPVFTADDALPTSDETARKAQADAQKVEAKAKQTKDAAEDKAKQGAEKAKQTADVAADKAKQAAGTVEAKAKETKDAVASKAEDVKDKAKQTAADVEAEAKKDYSAAKSEVKKGAAKTEQTAEQAADNAAETTKFEYDALSTQAKAAYNKMSKEARQDWHKLSKESKKRWEEAKNSEAAKELQKPEVWGSLLGVTNLALLGGVAYVAISNWNKPRWDRRVVSATVIGLGTWFGLQGWLIPQTDAVKQRRS